MTRIELAYPEPQSGALTKCATFTVLKNGIEPLSQGPNPCVLPLHYSKMCRTVPACHTYIFISRQNMVSKLCRIANRGRTCIFFIPNEVAYQLANCYK